MVTRRLCLLGAALMAGGCMGGPASQIYVMSTAAVAERTAMTDGSIPALQVELATLPAFLDNSDILVRRGPHALDSSSTGRWGERLSSGITHALAADLARRLPGYRVMLGPPETAAGSRLRLEVDSFDVQPDGRCVLAASWAIVQRAGAAPPAVGRGVFATPAAGVSHVDDGVLVRAMAATVAQLADAIAGTL